MLTFNYLDIHDNQFSATRLKEIVKTKTTFYFICLHVMMIVSND